MTDHDRKLVQEHISEIRHYRAVLSRLVKRPVTLDQAIADWFQQGFHQTPRRRKLPETAR